MKIVVINGTEKHGVTYELKEMFLNEFRNVYNNHIEIKEFYLPRDCNSFCVGCTACFAKGEKFCKDFSQVSFIKESILESDLVVFAFPVYVFHVPGALKSLLDHLGHMWIVHRPESRNFGKRAAIITQCMGAGASSAIKDLKDSLSWWGIGSIKVYKGAIMDSSIEWNNMSEKRKSSLSKGVINFGKKMAGINYSKKAKTPLITKIKFNIVRMMQKDIKKSGIDSIDAEHWEKNGWLGKNRPWKGGEAEARS